MPARAFIRITHLRLTRQILAKLDRLLAEPEVIACGEIGLDYYHEGAPHDVQREGLIRNWRLPPRASGPSSSIAGQRTSDRRLGRSFRDSGSALAAHRAGRRDALLWRRMGAGSAVAGSGLSGFVCRKSDLSQGAAAARCGGADATGRGSGGDGRALAGSGARSRQAQRAGMGGADGAGFGRVSGGRIREEIASATTKNFFRLFRPTAQTWETDRGHCDAAAFVGL